MRTLFVISMFCFFSLLGAVLALVRRVYQGQRQLARRERLLERLERRQRLLRTRDLPFSEDANQTTSPHEGAAVAYTIAGRPMGQQPPLPPHRSAGSPSMPQGPVRQQSVRDLAPQKAPDWRFMVHPGNSSRSEDGDLGSFPGLRKRPQATDFGSGERLDWAYFNKDLGDLSDPYEPHRPTGTSPSTNGTIRERF